ncbi:MAG: hypothetical protein HY557_03435 [Euryarchaeota archaeon]|nr:hypothetical protein [Euryarchaeota archaeon]
MAYQPPPRRPIGVVVLAVLVILAGILLTLIALLAVLAALLLLAVAGGVVLAGALIFLFLSLILLGAGFGLLNLRPWAWWLSVIVLVLIVLSRIGNVVLLRLRALDSGTLIAFAIPLLILIYLIAVRGHFRSYPAYAPR